MLTSREVAVLDANAAALGVSRGKLMESAGNAIAGVVREVAEEAGTITVVAGRGNNGGDGFVAARFLDDFPIEVVLLGRPESIRTDIARENWEALTAMEAQTRTVPDASDLDLGEPSVVVDALLGTGITGEPREPERSAISAINESDATVVSVDVPSGIDGDTGEAAGIAVEADRVVTFHDQRVGLADRTDVTVADIGIPDAASRFTGPGDCLRLERDPEAHKGEFGRVLVIGGGPYTGAPALSARAALRAGADLAFVAAPHPVAETIQGYTPDLIVEDYEGSHLAPEHVPGLLDRAADQDVVVIGPGLGDADATRRAVEEFLGDYEGRAVVDADALQAVPSVETDATLVCTPHQGELRDMGGPSATDWEQRADAVETYAADVGHTFLVKGRYDVISDGERTRVNRTGNPGMTVGGTGDVLAGAAAALLAGLEPREAAALAAYANGTAGDAVEDDYGHGLVASDLLDELPAALWGEQP